MLRETAGSLNRKSIYGLCWGVIRVPLSPLVFFFVGFLAEVLLLVLLDDLLDFAVHAVHLLVDGVELLLELVLGLVLDVESPRTCCCSCPRGT